MSWRVEENFKDRKKEKNRKRGGKEGMNKKANEGVSDKEDGPRRESPKRSIRG